MKINNPLVSIIVPVYNIEKYVDKCLHSLINQTYKNIEIILVNDKSTDNSLKVCEKYKTQDSRIKLINNSKNLGLSGTRNVGMKKMAGKYVMFVDGDDWVDKDCVEECVKCLGKKTDIILFPFKKEFSKKTVEVKLFNKEKIFSEKEIKEEIVRKLIGPYKEELKNPIKMDNISSAWGKIYKREIIEKKKFLDTKKIGIEDGIMNISCFLDSKNIKYIERTFYHYRKTNSSSLTQTYNEEIFERWKNLYAEIRKYCINETYKEALNNRIIINLLTGSLRVTNSALSYYDKKVELSNILNDKLIEESFKEFDTKYLTIIWKIYYIVCKKKMVHSLIVLNSSISLFKKLKWGNA